MTFKREVIALSPDPGRYANTKGFIYNDFGEECAEIYADSSSILHIVLALHFMIMMMVGSHLAKIDQLLLPPHAAAAALCCKSSVQSTPLLHITRWGL